MRLVTCHKEFYSVRGLSMDRSTLLALPETEPPADQLPEEEDSQERRQKGAAGSGRSKPAA
jgi:hypothetical protein